MTDQPHCITHNNPGDYDGPYWTTREWDIFPDEILER